MSYRVTVEIMCDTDGCYERLAYSQINVSGLSKTLAGALAERDGWDIPGRASSKDPKRAFCPKHRREAPDG